LRSILQDCASGPLLKNTVKHGFPFYRIPFDVIGYTQYTVYIASTYFNFFQKKENAMYNACMRTTTKTRPECGARLAALRREAGLSQKELAEKIGVAASNIGFWELHDKPPRSDLLPRIAEALGASVEDILGTSSRKRPSGGPEGRARRVFKNLSQLPRRQQKKILDVAEALIAQSNGK